MREVRPHHPFDRERPGSRVELRVSLHNEPVPSGGVVDPPFRWADVLHAVPPGDAERGPPAWCVHAPAFVAADARVENAVLVRVIEGRIEIEDRLGLTQRALAPFIETERQTVGLRLEEARAAAESRAEDADHPVEEALHRVIARVFGATRSLTRGVATVPDRLANASRRAYAFLHTPEGRRRFRDGLLDPHGLTREQKAVTLFVGVSGILGALAVAHFAVTLAAPDLARPWRTMFFLFLYGFVAALGLPMPIEPALLPATLTIGPWAAVATALCAKVLAAWMVFFLGDEIGHRLREASARRPWLERVVGWSERFAQRFGVAAVAAFLAIPGAPDAIALYVFGSLHMRLWKFLLGVAIGGAILYSALAFGFLAVFG
ncbi:MAG TPA: VTT domain-containing protein [Candidatus Thermoplasmatota archaeon]|nr:VTT domain-containing protein [Candidatus Thermoplasmatota archaeon]